MKSLKIFLFIISMLFVSQIVAQTVYITKTGEKYHTNNCRYLKYSKKEISLESAKTLGYNPCSVCKPITTISKSNNTNASSYSNSNKTSTTTKKVIATRCTGRTKSGNRCKRKTKNATGRCYQH